jgi:hypothetical protein
MWHHCFLLVCITPCHLPCSHLDKSYMIYAKPCDTSYHLWVCWYGTTIVCMLHSNSKALESWCVHSIHPHYSKVHTVWLQGLNKGHLFGWKALLWYLEATKDWQRGWHTDMEELERWVGQPHLHMDASGPRWVYSTWMCRVCWLPRTWFGLCVVCWFLFDWRDLFGRGSNMEGT